MRTLLVGVVAVLAILLAVSSYHQYQLAVAIQDIQDTNSLQQIAVQRALSAAADQTKEKLVRTWTMAGSIKPFENLSEEETTACGRFFRKDPAHPDTVIFKVAVSEKVDLEDGANEGVLASENTFTMHKTLIERADGDATTGEPALVSVTHDEENYVTVSILISDGDWAAARCLHDN